MAKPEQSFQQFSLDDFKNHPEIVIDALSESKNVSIMLRRDEDQVYVYFKKNLDDKTYAILSDAKAEYKRKKEKGYTREQAFRDFMEAREEIMDKEITLTLSNSELNRAINLAAIISRPVEDVLAETLEITLPDLNAEAQPPMSSFSDDEVQALAQTRMEGQQSARYSELLDKQQAGNLTEDERSELHGLFHTYLRLWLRQSQALAEAVSRGVLQPLSA